MSRHAISNEGKVCDAVIRHIEARAKAVRERVRFPEKSHSGPPVDVILDIGKTRYAVEHTLIEAFANQKASDERFLALIDPVVKELSGKLPTPGRYEIWFPIDPRVGGNRERIAEVQAVLIEWVRRKASELHAEQPQRLSRDWQPFEFANCVTEQPSGLPFEVTLTRRVHWSDDERHDGILLPGRIAPPNVEDLRGIRIDVALNRKCPKLQECKAEQARTVLVLEENDLAQTNHALIGEALAATIQSRDDRPDEIYLLSTDCVPWTLWEWRYATNWWDEYVDVPVEDLNDITGSEVASGMK